MDVNYTDLSVNPFYHRLHFTFFGYVQLISGFLILFPIRIVIGLLLLFLTWLTARISYGFVLLFYSHRVHEKRYIFVKPSVVLLRALFFVLGFYRIEIINKETIKRKDELPCIYTAAPHSAMTDIVVFLLLGCPSIVSKKEVLSIPIFGFLVQLTRPILVDRVCSDSRKTTIDAIKEVASERDVFIFPEGTCTNRTSLISFKGGAFLPSLPVQPIAIDYHCKPENDIYSWAWEGPSAIQLMVILLCKWRSKLTVTFLPKYYPNESEKSNPKFYAQNVRLEMAKYLRLPLSSYSFDDIFYMEMAKRNQIPRTSTCLKYLKLCSKIKEKQTNDSQCNLSSKQKSIEIKHFLSDFTRNTICSLKENPDEEIKNPVVLFEALNLTQYNEFESSITDDLFDCLSLGCFPYLPNNRDLLLVCLLCDSSIGNDFWSRLSDWKALTSEVSKERQLRLLIWLLVGIRLSDEEINCFLKSIDDDLIDYFKQNLTKLFKKPCEQNLPFL